MMLGDVNQRTIRLPNVAWQKLVLLAIAVTLTAASFALHLWNLDWHPSTWTLPLTPEHLTETIDQTGIWGPLLYILLITVSVVISQIPGAPLAIAAGTVWHPAIAGLYTVIGGFGGALVAYGLGRWVGQPIVAKLTGQRFRLSGDKGDRYLGLAIFITRLLPIFSFDLISYAAGISGLSLPVYASATFFGMVPSTLLLTYLGGTFDMNSTMLLTITAVLLPVLIGLPVLMHRYNWFDIRSILIWD